MAGDSPSCHRPGHQFPSRAPRRPERGPSVQEGFSATRLIDIPQLTSSEKLAVPHTGQTAAIIKTRLCSEQRGDYYHYLWHGSKQSSNFSFLDPQSAADEFWSYSSASDIFMTALLSDFNSHQVRQYAPRMNSAISWETIHPEDFPANCSMNNDYFRNYTAANSEGLHYMASVCMPGNLSTSPFASTRDRQDFDEVLYVSLSYHATSKATLAFKWTLSTTAGYFELPNTSTDDVPGPC